MISVIKAVDNHCIGIVSFVNHSQQAHQAMQQRDALTAIEKGSHGVILAASLVRNMGSFFEGISKIAYIFYTKIFKYAPNDFTLLCQSFALQLSVSVIGTVVNVFTLIEKSVQITKNMRLRALFEKCIWREGEVAPLLEKLRNTSLQGILPVWLSERLSSQSGVEYLQRLQEGVARQDISAIQESASLFSQIECYSKRKQIELFLRCAIACLGLLAFVGYFTFPPTLILSLFVVSVVLGIGVGVFNRGWVENPNPGFSFLLCLPSWIRNRIRTEENLSNPPLHRLGEVVIQGG